MALFESRLEAGMQAGFCVWSGSEIVCFGKKQLSSLAAFFLTH